MMLGDWGISRIREDDLTGHGGTAWGEKNERRAMMQESDDDDNDDEG